MISLHMIHSIAYFINLYGYAGLFSVAFLESSFFFPLPGDSLLFTAGIFATQGYFNIYLLVAVFFVATFLGSIFGYWLGLHTVRLQKYTWYRKLVSEQHLRKVHDFYVTYGMVAIVFARFIPIVRTFAPIGAGVGKMNYKLFIKYNLIGAILWAGGVTMLGYYLGKAFPQIQDYFSLIIVLIVLVSVLPGVWHWYRERKKA